MTVESVTERPLAYGTLSRGAELEALADEWDELVLALRRPTPFLLHAWLTTWWRDYGADATLDVQVAWRDGRLVAALPLIRNSRLGLRVTTFLGGRDAALRDVLVASGEPESTAHALAERAAAGHDYAEFPGLPAGSRLAGALESERLHLVERNEAPVLDLTPGWDEVYRSHTSGKRRNLHRRRRRQLASLGRLESSVARTLEDVDAALDETFALHELRWRGRPDGSGYATPRGRRFHRDVIRALAPLDRVRIVLLRLDGRTIAFHYFFVFAGTMFVHRLAFDPALGRYSPGLVNTLDALEAAAEEGLTRVEFLGGGERYKLELADGLDPLYHGLGLEGSLRGRAAVRAQLGYIAARKRLKRSSAARKVYVEGLAPVRRLAARAADLTRRAGAERGAR